MNAVAASATETTTIITNNIRNDLCPLEGSSKHLDEGTFQKYVLITCRVTFWLSWMFQIQFLDVVTDDGCVFK